jgi:hypothetical protein
VTVFDVSADHDKREYYVIRRETGEVVATYRYKARSESSRGIAHGRANCHRNDLIDQERKLNEGK